jgi:hypothetical protein
VRRQIPYILLAVLVLLTGAFTVISYDQSTASGSSIKLPLRCKPLLAVKPSTYIVSCADGNSELADLHWTDWGDETAYATGEARWNDCTPTCVAGHWRRQPVTFWLWDPQREHPDLTVYTKLGSDSHILNAGSVSRAHP